MSESLLTGNPTPAPERAAGKDVDALGPSDSTDSGSDVQGERSMATAPDNPGEWGAMTTDTDSDSDAMGTGERASATRGASRDGADILPDRIVGGADLDDDAGAIDPLDLDAVGAVEADGAAGENDDDLDDEDEEEDDEQGAASAAARPSRG